MIAATPFAFGDAADRKVVALGGAACENDLTRVGSYVACDQFSGGINRIASFVAGSMDAMWIAVLRVEVRQHRLNNARVDARRGVVVHVDNFGGSRGHG